jgi:hypothetical protein
MRRFVKGMMVKALSLRNRAEAQSSQTWGISSISFLCDLSGSARKRSRKKILLKEQNL